MKDAVIVEKILHAPVLKVWNAITDRNEMKEWYFDLEEFKAEIGFTFKFTGGPDDGPVYVHICEVTEVILHRKLSYSWKYEGFPGISYVTWELEAKGDNTLLTLTHTGLDTIAPGSPDFAHANFKEGWNEFVNQSLPTYLDKSKTIG